MFPSAVILRGPRQIKETVYHVCSDEALVESFRAYSSGLLEFSVFTFQHWTGVEKSDLEVDVPERNVASLRNDTNGISRFRWLSVCVQ